MILTWLVYGLLVSTLAGVAGWLAERGFRERGWPGRWAWAGGLAASVALPVWAWLAPTAEPATGAPLPGALVMQALPPLVLEPSAAQGPSVAELVALVWIVATALLVTWLVWSAVRLARASRGWGRAEVDGVPVLVSERTGPAAMGLVRGWVVLPRWALDLDAGRRRLMVLHEAEHVRARDPQLAVAGLVLCALMPWNVAAWWQLRRLRLAIEMDCDARVLRRAGDVRSYGSLLLEVGQRRRTRLAVGLAEPRTSLERRIRMMTRTTTGRRTIRALGLAAAAAGVLVMACETPGPTEVAAPETRPVELEQVGAETALLDCSPVFYVNGAHRPGFTANDPAIPPERIESVEVVKGPGASKLAGESAACGVILITTKDATPVERAAIERLVQRLRPAPVRSAAELAAAPTFTPMTARPTLKNVAAVREALQANYPPLLKDAGIGGTANVWFFIAADGTVEKVQVNETSGYPALDEAALRVARTMEFTPAYLHDAPTPVWVALDITFDSSTSEERSAVRPELAERAAREPVRRPPAATDATLARAPTFTPMTERPQLRNHAEVEELLLRHYPPLLRNAGIGGEARVWFFIEANGAVGDVRIHESSGHEALDEAALRVAREMEFTPALDGDQPVPVWVSLAITFDVAN